MRGKTSPIEHDGRGLFRGLPYPFDATRYHSLLVDEPRFRTASTSSAWTPEGESMGLRHRTLDVEGVQFHPESVLTTHGRAIVAQWVSRISMRTAS